MKGDIVKVSIIIPVYNGEKYIQNCIDSVINQTYKNLEIIIVNDGSKDDTLSVLKKYKTDKRIKIINKENGGLSSARNTGLKYVSGKYLMFLDSDDYLSLDAIEKMISASSVNNSDITICDFLVEYDDKTEIKKGLELNQIDIKSALVSSPSACNKIYKINVFNVAFPLKKYYEDLGTIPIIISNCSKISYVDEALYHYIQRNGSIMHQETYNRKLEDIFFILDRIYNSTVKTKYPQELEYIYVKHLLHDASLRFLNFNNNDAKKSLNKIVKIMKKKYPNWKKNKYLNLMSKQELILTRLIYKKFFFIYKFYRKVKSS